MADLGEAIAKRLEDDSGVGAIAANRIYPVILPQDPDLPAVTYQTVAGDRETAMGTNPGIANPLVQVDCWARTHAEARSLALAVKASLERWRGTVASVEVLDVFPQREEDSYEWETNMWRSSWDYQFHHRE